MRCPGPQARSRNTQAVQRGDILDHILILTLVHHRATPTDCIDQDQKGGITYQALLEIHYLIRGPGADLIPEVGQGPISGFGHPWGQITVDQDGLLHILGHCLVLDPDAGQGQEPDQTLGIVQKPHHVPGKEMSWDPFESQSLQRAVFPNWTSLSLNQFKVKNLNPNQQHLQRASLYCLWVTVHLLLDGNQAKNPGNPLMSAFKKSM